MKKILVFIFLFSMAYSIHAQTKYTDSLKALLAVTAKPIERFDLLNKIYDKNDATQGLYQDTALGIQIHRLAQQINNDSLLAISTNVIGNYFRSKGDFPMALEYFFKAIPLAEKAKDKRRISSVYFDIAECYFGLQNLESCFKYAKKGEDNLPDKTSPMYDNMVIQFYRTMGRYYLEKKQPDSALVYIHELEEVNRRLKKSNYAGYGFTQSGTAYALLGDNEMAELYFKKASALSDSIGTPVIIINNSVGYIPYLLRTNQIAKARQYTLRLLETGNRLNNNVIKLTAAGFLNTVCNNLHQSDSAYFYLSMQSALKDSVFSQNNFNKIQALAFNEEIRKIDEEARQKQKEEQRKQNIQFALIAFGIITFIVLFLLFSRSVVANERLISFFGVLGLLIVFEFMNLLIHPWLASFTHESPVLMLLALVLIASLLIPLHHRLEKWIKEKMTEKNKAIRLAAAKKTIEKLGREENS